jgi:hypothetical protein
MLVSFLIWTAAIIAVFTICAAAADFSLWLQERWQAEVDDLEDAEATRGTGS